MQRFSDEWIAGLLKAAGDDSNADCAREKFKDEFYKQRQADFKKHFPPRPVTRARFLRAGRVSHFVQGGMLAGVAVMLCAAGSDHAPAPAPQTTGMTNSAPAKAPAPYPADQFSGPGPVAPYRMSPVTLIDMPRTAPGCAAQRAP